MKPGRTRVIAVHTALLALPLVSSACGVILGDDFELAKEPCSPLQAGVCGASKKCSVIDTTTGATGCVEAGPRPAWASCLGDANCVEGTYCSGDWVCEPVCATGDTCPNGGWCVAALDANWAVIPGLNVCTANCQPITGAPCDQSYGSVTCGLWGADQPEFTCYAAGGYGEGTPCDGNQINCGSGLQCPGDAPFVCRRWCTPIGQQSNCPLNQLCSPLSNHPTEDGVEYGLCY
jgi:hypothetical protein